MTSCDSDKRIRDSLENMQSLKIHLFHDSMRCINLGNVGWQSSYERTS